MNPVVLHELDSRQTASRAKQRDSELQMQSCDVCLRKAAAAFGGPLEPAAAAVDLGFQANDRDECLA